MTDFTLDPNLREYATDRQWEILTAWEEEGSQEKAAASLGCTKNIVGQASKAVLKRAARAGYIPPETSQFHMKSRVPAGFILKGQSALVGEDGKTRQRWDKTTRAGLEPDAAHRLPDPKKTIKLSTQYGPDGSIMSQWVAEKPEDQARETAWRAFAKELAEDIPRLAPLSAPAPLRSDMLTVYPVGDHHVGMFSWAEETGGDYDTEIAGRLLQGAMQHLVSIAARGDTGLIVFLGDFMHYDSMFAVTPTSRNELDSDTRFPKMVKAARCMMQGAIDLALQAHQKVHVIVEIGNHDLASSIWLMEVLTVLYGDEPRVTIDTSPMHYHYYRFGKVLIGSHHGHGTKMAQLPLTMANDRPEDWGQTEFRHWLTGHIHHSKTQAAISAQDYSGCTVESFRILAPPDAWAHQKGYRPFRDMKAINYHAEHGEVERHTVNPKMIEGGE